MASVLATLARGQSGPVSVDEVLISVDESPAAADLSAFLLNRSGRVRRDGDLIFYNNRRGPGLWLVAGEPVNSVSATLSRVPADVASIRLVLSRDDAQSAGRAVLTLRDGHGEPLYEFPVDWPAESGAVVVADLERSRGGWALRAVGQVQSGGLSDTVTAHGVRVGEGGRRPVNGPLALAPGRRADVVPGITVELRRDTGDPLTYVKMALGWDPIRVPHHVGGLRDADIDLDASALLYSGRRLYDYVYFGKLITEDGSVRHLGDNLTGAGEGDNEVVTLDLVRMPPEVTSVVFVVTSYRGQAFDRVSNAFWRLVDGTTESELARFDLLGGGRHTGMVMARLFRDDAYSPWLLEAIGEGISARHPSEAAEQMIRFLG
jgi:stress response protein SCP2